LTACDKFILDRWRIDRPASLNCDGRFHIVTIIEGQVTLRSHEDEQQLRRGHTVLIPASCDGAEITPQDSTALLDMYLP
jgi:mannose-6-phosphate isomerase